MYASEDTKAGTVIASETAAWTTPVGTCLDLYNGRLEWALVHTVLSCTLRKHEEALRKRLLANLDLPAADPWFFEEDRAIRYWLVWCRLDLPSVPDDHAWAGWSWADDTVETLISHIHMVDRLTVRRLFNLATHGLVTSRTIDEATGQQVNSCLSLFKTLQKPRHSEEANSVYELDPLPDQPHRVLLRATLDIAKGEEITVNATLRIPKERLTPSRLTANPFSRRPPMPFNRDSISKAHLEHVFGLTANPSNIDCSVHSYPDTLNV